MFYLHRLQNTAVHILIPARNDHALSTSEALPAFLAKFGRLWMKTRFALH